jgi:hypothetical protein
VHHYWKLHCPCTSWLNTSKSMQGDHWLRSLPRPCITFLVAQYFNNKELLTYLFVAMGEQIIAVKAMACRVMFNNFCRGQLLDCWRFGDRRRGRCCAGRLLLLAPLRGTNERVWCCLGRWWLHQCGGVRCALLMCPSKLHRFINCY